MMACKPCGKATSLPFSKREIIYERGIMMRYLGLLQAVKAEGTHSDLIAPAFERENLKEFYSGDCQIKPIGELFFVIELDENNISHHFGNSEPINEVARVKFYAAFKTEQAAKGWIRVKTA